MKSSFPRLRLRQIELEIYVSLHTSVYITCRYRPAANVVSSLSRVWESVLISRYGTMSCPPSQSADGDLKEIAMRQSAEDANDDG